jgi:hypothetical protein
MNNILNKMCDLLKMQETILNELENITENEVKDFITTEDNNKMIDITDLENIEKYYFMLDNINKKLYYILESSKKQKEKLFYYSTNIRNKIKKTNNIVNENKFINILNSHFDGSCKENQLNPELHKDVYQSIKRYHELNKEDNKFILYKTVNLVGDKNISIPIINNLNEIPPMFYWYKGDKKNKEGIYASITPHFYIEVPFPDLINKSSKNFKHKSIPCKYKTINQCKEKQLEFSKIYNTEIRQCNYVHIGENFIKIGSDFRCPNLSSFGSFETLDNDLYSVSLADIKNILFNSSSDLLLILLWYSNHKNLGELVFTNLDKYLM